MQLSQSVKLKQKQSLVMTPQLQQAIKLLQLSNLELSQHLQAQVDENPFLELGETEDSGQPLADGTADKSADTAASADAPDLSDLKESAALAEDPTEQEDVSAANPEKIAQLSALLDAHNSRQAPPRWPSAVYMPIWVDKTPADAVTLEDDYILWPN